MLRSIKARNLDLAIVALLCLLANTAWHELVELMSDSVAGKEIVDPVAPYKWGYVFQNYYQVSSPGPWDNLGRCPGPNQPAPGGF